jgi:hypothetical protein
MRWICFILLPQILKYDPSTTLGTPSRASRGACPSGLSEVDEGLHWIRHGSVLQLALNVLKDQERPRKCICANIIQYPACAPCEARSDIKQKVQKDNFSIKKNERVHFKYFCMSLVGVIQHPRTGRHLVTDGSFVLCEGEMRDGIFQV